MGWRSIHVSAMAAKLSMASGAALSKPTFCSARAMPRRRPFFANSSVLIALDEYGDDPIFSSESMVCGDCRRCRFAGEASSTFSAGRFLESGAIAAECLSVAIKLKIDNARLVEGDSWGSRKG